MSNIPMMIILAVGFFVLIVFACIFLFVLSRLRRVIRSQAEAIETITGAVRASQGHDKPGESPQVPT
ncbi:MAG TPA: DUF948 domain-containing protein [Pseudonocardiaceae bacterium]|nr:DUF948 domain-containing protein [Pseudonocardiaceae bacterium]